MKKNLIFLDIDGVLNNQYTIFKDPNASFLLDEENIKNFQTVQKYLDCDIVISSTWRYWKEGMDVVRKRGIDFIDITPRRKDNWRENEIFEWLSKSSTDYNWIAIDDDDYDMKKLVDMNKLYHVNGQFGFTERDAQRVRKLFDNDFK